MGKNEVNDMTVVLWEDAMSTRNWESARSPAQARERIAELESRGCVAWLAFRVVEPRAPRRK